MTDEKKAIEQAMEAAVAELKAKGAAAKETAEAETEAAAAEPSAEAAPETPSEPEKKETEAEPEKAAEEKKPEKKGGKKSGKKTAKAAGAAVAEKASDKKSEDKKTGDKKSADKKSGAKKPAGKKGAKALKELARVRRNKIIGITAAVIAIMVGIFFIARGAAKPAPVAANGQPSLSVEEHGGAPEIKDDGTEIYPDGTVVEPDGTVKDGDGNVIDHVSKTDSPAVTPAPYSPGDANMSNVQADNGGAGGAGDTPWYTMADGDYGITIRRLNGYSGPFVEDQSDEQVSNVLALQFRNDSNQDVQYAEYVFDVNGEDVIFRLSDLPRGQQCVVFALNRHTYNANEVLKLKSRLVASVDQLHPNDDAIMYVVSDDSITLMNLTDQPIPVARVFYKTYYEEQDTFIGGITYSFEVQDIPANGSKTVTSDPETGHFSGQVSVITGYAVYES